MRHLFFSPLRNLSYEKRTDPTWAGDPAPTQSHGHDAGRTGLPHGCFAQSVAKWETGLSSPDIDRLALLRDVLQTSLDELIAPAGRELIPEPAPPAEDSVRPEPAGPVRNLRLLPLILGTLLFCCGLGGLAALWVLSRLHPVRLVDWDGSLHTGLEGYLMATGLWPVLLLACILLGCGSLTLLYLWGTRRKNS